MLLCGPDPDSCDSVPVFAVPALGDGWPLTRERMVYDKGPHMASRLHKRSEDLLDYCLDLRRFLEPGDTVSGASATLCPVTTPVMTIARLEYAPYNVVVWLDGGKSGQSYQVSVFIRTVGGREKLFRFFVSARGDAAIHSVAPNAAGPANVCSGLAPNLILSASQLSFPDTEVDTVSAAIAVTVTNTGATPATITSIVASSDFSVASDTGGVLAQDESFTLWVRFAPSQAGTTGGYVIIDGNAPAQLVLLAQAV